MQMIKTVDAKRLSSDVNYVLAAVITNKYLSFLARRYPAAHQQNA